MRTCTIAAEAPRQPEVLEFLRLGAEYSESLYPPEHSFLLSVGELEHPDVRVYVARGADGTALGMAAAVRGADTGGVTSTGPEHTAELKRMFVSPAARGLGVGDALLEALEAESRALGIASLVLETGPLNEAAIRLYRKHGFQDIPLFGQYVGEPFSLCLAKTI